jgi:hypothetical protein
MSRQRCSTTILQNLLALSRSQTDHEAEMFRKLEKCQETMKASALLADALNASLQGSGNHDALLPDASWIHPLV